MCLHLAFVVILLGALLTHLSSYQGIIHLRVNESTKQYLYQDKKVGMKLKDLPFYLETPCDLQGYRDEIALIKKLRSGS